MWYKAQSTDIPRVVDSLSSKVFVYVRRNITERKEEDGTYYEYEETKMSKDVYDIFLSQQKTNDRVSEIEDVIAEIIGGEI